jgi:hypothetical protein
MQLLSGEMERHELQQVDQADLASGTVFSPLVPCGLVSVAAGRGESLHYPDVN